MVGPGTSAANSDGVDQAIGAWLVTPTATYDVSDWEDGGDYGNLAYQESQLFDLTNPVPDPFGSLEATPDGSSAPDPDFAYQTGDVFGNTAYGTQTFDFDSTDLTPSIDQFLANNVTVNGEPFNVSTNLPTDVQANVIDQVDFNGLFNGFADQQIFLPTIDGTNIQDGVINIENLGNGYSYDYIDLVESGTNSNAVGAWLVTPEGTYDVSSFAAPEVQMFDPSYFDPTAFFPDAGLMPPLDFLS